MEFRNDMTKILVNSVSLQNRILLDTSEEKWKSRSQEKYGVNVERKDDTKGGTIRRVAQDAAPRNFGLIYPVLWYMVGVKLFF